MQHELPNEVHAHSKNRVPNAAAAYSIASIHKCTNDKSA